MSKHINPAVMYTLPSGQIVHPCRLIHRDGILMWKHALLYQNEVTLPTCTAHEVHIQKTAQRLEELNSWMSQDYEPWNSLNVYAWYTPQLDELSEGISVYFNHAELKTNEVYNLLHSHIQDHETLELRNNYLYFKRC